MTRGTQLIRIGCAAAALAGAAAPAAGAATTIGSSLAQRANLFISCGTPGEPLSRCTTAQSELPNRETAVASDGVIVRWRIRSASGGVVRLRVLRPAGASGFTGAGTSQPETLRASRVAGRDATYTFSTRLPVRAGDIIGVDRERRAGALFHASSGAATLLSFQPPLADLESRVQDRISNGAELLVNADIEPDADRDGFGDETQDNCPTIANPDQSTNPCPQNQAQTPTGGGGGSNEVGTPTRRPQFHRYTKRPHHSRRRIPRVSGADPFSRHRR
jgi:hypothetical protein